MSESSLARVNAGELNAALHRLRGREVLVVVSLEDRRFSMAVEGRVTAVLEEGDAVRVTVEFDGGQALTLATTEVQAFAGASDRNGVRALWIEVHAASSATVVIEELSAEFLQPPWRVPD